MGDRGAASSLKFIALYALLFLGTFGGFFILKALMGTEYPIMVVVSNSMEPTLGVGDYIFIQGVDDANRISSGPQGDILVFPRPGTSFSEYVVHRAVGRVLRGNSLFFVTKGDNNLGTDPWEVPAYSIVGKVYGRAPFIGYFSLYERTSGGIITLVALICLVLFFDYLVPAKAVGTPNVASEVNSSGGNLRSATTALLLLSVLPYPLSYVFKDTLLAAEAVSLVCWYASDLLLPSVIKDEDNSLMLWLYHFVLVTLPVSTDIIYRITRIMPRDWWFEPRGSVPLTWFLSGETAHYYRYLSMLGLMLIPGCIVFFFSMTRRRRGEKILPKL